MKDGERERPIENYGKKEQKEWFNNILPDPHPCTAGNKEEEHVISKVIILLCSDHDTITYIFISFGYVKVVRRIELVISCIIIINIIRVVQTDNLCF